MGVGDRGCGVHGVNVAVDWNHWFLLNRPFHIVISLADYSSMEVRIVTCKHEWGNVILALLEKTCW